MSNPLLYLQSQSVTGGPISDTSKAFVVIETDDDVVWQTKTSLAYTDAAFINWSNNSQTWAMFIRMGQISGGGVTTPNGIAFYTSHSSTGTSADLGMVITPTQDVAIHKYSFLGTKTTTYKYRQQRLKVSGTSNATVGGNVTINTSVPTSVNVVAIDGVIAAGGNIVPLLYKESPCYAEVLMENNGASYWRTKVVSTESSAANAAYTVCFSINTADSYPAGVPS